MESNRTPGGSADDTPIMKQYWAAKAKYPRHLMFFRVGDFYELFYEDAKTAARVLGLTLTSRNKGAAEPIPMAGVPAHTVEQYLARLLRQGFAVAICDQTEDSSQAKGLVKRDINRVVTPGTVLEESLLDARKPNRVVAVCGSEIFGLASVDLTSGSFYVLELPSLAALKSELVRLAPSECLIADNFNFEDKSLCITKLKPEAFQHWEAHDRIVRHFGENDRSRSNELRNLCKQLPAALAAAGALLGYIFETHAGGKVLLRPPQPFDPDEFVLLNDAAIRSLELVETMRSRNTEGSLLASIDQTCSGAGSRCLREWLIRPLRKIDAIRARQDAVGALVDSSDQRRDLRDAFGKLADLERISARLAANRATPRDLIALKNSLRMLPHTASLAERISSGMSIIKPEDLPPNRAQESAEKLPLLDALASKLTGFDKLADTIAATLRDDCANVINEGGLILDGADAELDRLRAISTGGKGWIANFQATEAERTGIGSLKVGYNRVFGYYIEISRANKNAVPADYERRQTLTNAERYTTPALKEREAEVLGAEEKICALEQKLFLKLRDEIAKSAEQLHECGRSLAQLDALAALAELAQKKNHVRPALSNSGKLIFEQMRHPVLEDLLPRGELVPNDLALNTSNGDAPQILLLTGPNMAGKSTYIRAAALCAILAQMGAYVPAEKAEIGLVDSIFTRVGAADDLAGGRSTFMVEMTEVAEILGACSNKSLVILDEVGRGTSTYDGVSLAWAIVEHLHEGPSRPRTLFATHYHELCSLSESLPRVKNASAAVKEWQGEITFLHRIIMGPSERSFGIHVARLAGLPKEVLERARAILNSLESETSNRVSQVSAPTPAPEAERGRRKSKNVTQLNLFEAQRGESDAGTVEILEILRAMKPDTMTPLQALSALDELVKKARKK